MQQGSRSPGPGPLECSNESAPDRSRTRPNDADDHDQDLEFETDSDPASDTDQATDRGPTVVGIPAYNAAGSVGEVVRAAIPHADLVVVVDDGSGDQTGDRARAAGATVVSHRQNGGYGAALKTLFREAAARGAGRLVILDADGQHDPADVGRLAAAIDDAEADIVVGSRFTEGGDTDAPIYRRVGLAVINWLTNASLGRGGRARIADTQSGFRAYSERAVASLATADDVDDRMGASLDILYYAARRDWVVTEVGTTVTYEVENANTSNPVRHGLQLLGRIFRRTVRDRFLSRPTRTASVATPFRSDGGASESQSRPRSRR